MIVNTSTGVLAAGSIAADPSVRQAGSRSVLGIRLRYGTEPAAAPGAKPQGKYIDIDIWHDIDELDGMLQKGDGVIVLGDGVKSREYNGKTYHSISASGLFVSADVVFRWMQQIVDMIPAAPNSPADAFSPVDEPTPFDAQNVPQAAPQPAQTTLYDARRSAPPAPDIAGGELYPGESLADYVPGRRNAAKPDPLGDEPIQADCEDLPF